MKEREEKGKREGGRGGKSRRGGIRDRLFRRRVLKGEEKEDA